MESAGRRPRRPAAKRRSIKAHGRSRGFASKASFSPEGEQKNPARRDTLQIRKADAFMANTKSLSKEERKKAKRAARKKRKAEKPLGKRTVPRGSAKRKVKKMARGQAKR